ncbi:MAG: cytochrome c [Parvularculaceae bacterium]
MNGLSGKEYLIPGLVGAGVLAALVWIYALDRPHADSNAGAQLQAGAQALAMRHIYLSRCAECHGDRGQGGESTVDFTSAPSVAALSRKRMINALDKKHDGRLDQDLTKSAKVGVVDFIREYLMLPAPFADASVGRRIYSEGCSVCHGERGDGASWAQNSLNPSPRNFADADPEILTREAMIAVTTFGKPGTAMMPFATQLSTDEIAATVDYIRFAFMSDPQKSAAAQASKSSSASVASSNDATTPKRGQALAGDPTIGAALYKINCEQCHGEKGDGQGRRAYFMVIKPADLTSAAVRMRMNDPARLQNAIAKGVVGSPMPAWETVLSSEKIADLAAYIHTTFINPEEGDDLEWSEDGAKKKD